MNSRRLGRLSHRDGIRETGDAVLLYRNYAVGGSRVGGPFESANGRLPLRIDDDHFTPIEH
jgi:hypothetical protein